MARPRLINAFMCLVLHASLSCDLFTFRYSCNPCTLQGLLHSRLQTRIGKTEVIKKRRTSFVLVHRFPSAIRSGSQLLPPKFQPARVRAAASAPFLAASWRIRAAANGWLFASTAGYCFKATRFLSSDIFYEFIKFLCNRAINQMTCSSCEMAPYQSQQSVKHESFSI